MKEKRILGLVEFFNKKEGYGFIVGGEEKFYVSFTNIIDDKNFKSLNPGQLVEFIPDEDNTTKGKQKFRLAKEVKVLDDYKNKSEANKRKIWSRSNLDYRFDPYNRFVWVVDQIVRFAKAELAGIAGRIPFWPFIQNHTTKISIAWFRLPERDRYQKILSSRLKPIFDERFVVVSPSSNSRHCKQ